MPNGWPNKDSFDVLVYDESTNSFKWVPVDDDEFKLMVLDYTYNKYELASLRENYDETTVTEINTVTGILSSLSNNSNSLDVSELSGYAASATIPEVLISYVNRYLSVVSNVKNSFKYEMDSINFALNAVIKIEEELAKDTEEVA